MRIEEFYTKLKGIWDELDALDPYELLYGVKPNYNTLIAFGCLCFVSSSNKSKTKIDLRASSCVFLGYSPHKKVYKLYDMQTKLAFV